MMCPIGKMPVIFLYLCLTIFYVKSDDLDVYNSTVDYDSLLDLDYEKNEISYGNWTKDLEGSGEPLPCPRVTNLTVRQILTDNGTIAIVSWMPTKKPFAKDICIAVNSLDQGCTKGEECFMLSESNETSIQNLCPYHSYDLVANFACGEIKGISTTISFKSKPSRPRPPKRVQLLHLNDTSLEVNWERPLITNGPIDGYVIKFGRHNKNETEFFLSSDQTSWTNHNLSAWTNYNFQISAFNKFDNETLSSTPQILNFTTEESESSPPRLVAVSAITNSSFRVEWRKPKEPNGKIRSYTVFWKQTNGESFNATTQTMNLTVRDSPLAGHPIFPYTDYVVYVRASNDYGLGLKSSVVPFTTKIGAPSEPRNLTAAQKRGSLRVTLSWEVPLIKGCLFGGYKLTFWRLEDKSTWNALTRNTSYVAEQRLLPWTNYTVHVCRVCVTEKTSLNGRIAQLIFQTEIVVPQQPTGVQANVMGSRKISLEWTNPTPFPGPIWFAIEVRKSNPCGEDEIYFKKIEDQFDANFTTITGLHPARTYTLKLVASTAAGNSQEWISEPLTTDPDVPSMPVNFFVNCTLGPTHVTLHWYEPEEKNGQIDCYLAEFIEDGKENMKRGRKKYYNNDYNMCEPPKPKQMLIKGLAPEVPYNFSIRALTVNVSNFGPEAYFSCQLPVGVPPLPFTRPEVKPASENEVSFLLNKRTFSQEMGSIIYYSVIVNTSIGHDEPITGRMDNYFQLPDWISYWKKNSDFYQATPSKWNPFTTMGHDPLKCIALNSSGAILLCALGKEKNCSEGPSRYCNGPLMPNTKYGLKIRGFTKAGFAETYTAVFETKGVYQSTSLIVGISLTCTTLIILFISFTLVRKKKIIPTDCLVHFRKTSQEEPDLTLSSLSKGIPSGIKRHDPLSFPSFLDHFDIMMSDSALKFSLEFEELKENSPKHPSTAANLEENRPKNRWTNILPFDHSRVKLLPIDDEPGSDYVNASYIPGFFSHREYIASQGPLPSTVDDFWRMIWEQKVSVVVMLTQCVERGKVKCEQYWPKLQGADEYYGDLKVEMTSEVVSKKFTIRSCILSLGSRHFTVKQIHYTHWPDFGCPESPEDLIRFVQAVKEIVPMNSGPILVHCSAGVGRTGTFIAVERLFQHIECNPTLDIYQTVLEMREHRLNMVQTEDQYIYIHKCLKELILKKMSEEAEETESTYANVNHTDIV